jgi:TRAP-type transport system periplasmic protein
MEIGRLLAAPSALIVAALAATPVSAADVELTAVTALSRNLALTHTFIQVGEELTRDSNGIRVRYLGGPEVTPPDRAAAALRRGVMDLLHSPASYYNGTIQETDALLVSERTPDELRKNGGWDLMQKIWNERLGARILAWYEPVFQDTPDGERRDLYNIYLTKKPPLDPEKGIDLSGFRMRSTATYRALFTALGAAPVSMPGSEIYTGLQRGVVQGFGFPGVAITGLGMVGVVKYRVDPAFFKGNNLVLMNLEKWQSLPQATRTLIEETFQAAEVRSNIYVGKEAAKEFEELKKGGMEVMQLEGQAAENFRRIAYDGIWERLKERAPDTFSDFEAKFRK